MTGYSLNLLKEELFFVPISCLITIQKRSFVIFINISCGTFRTVKFVALQTLNCERGHKENFEFFLRGSIQALGEEDRQMSKLSFFLIFLKV